MRIVTNPGANLTPKQIARYNVHLLPLLINVDGRSHDTRDNPSFDEVDRWITTAREYPVTLGSSASDFVDVFRTIAQTDREILVLCGSRKIIGTYKAAVSAARMVKVMPGFEEVRIEVVDSGSTDISLGLCCVIAGESARAGRSFGQTVELVERFAEKGVFLFVPRTLERLVKGGRASWTRAWIADLLKLSPLIGFKEGELVALGKVPREGDVPGAIVDAMVKRLGATRGVWAAVAHARAPEEAAILTKKIQERFAVVHLEERPFCTTSYIQAGRVVGAFIHPIDDLPWTPPIPPRA